MSGKGLGLPIYEIKLFCTIRPHLDHANNQKPKYGFYKGSNLKGLKKGSNLKGLKMSDFS